MLKPYQHIRFWFLLFVTIVLSITGNAQEICDNGTDDDNDNLTDLQDPDCQCRINVTANLLLNASFELYSKCPISYLYNEEYNIVDHWQPGTHVNINEAYFYHNFNCAYDSQQIMLRMPPFKPLPDGDGFISIFKSAYIDPNVPEPNMTKTYVGQCLQASLKPGEEYTVSFYAGRFRSWDNRPGKLYPFTVSVFGNADCNAVPFGKTDVYGNGCPANYPGWVLLGETTISNSGQWVQNKIKFTVPFEINVIEIGPDCSILPPIVDLIDSTTFLDYYQFYLDDLHLLPTKDFPFEYIHPETESSCADHLVLLARKVEHASYQWYKDSIAIPGATGDTYHVSNTGEKSYYNVRITTDSGCGISEPYLVAASKLGEIHIPADTILCDENTSLQLAPAFDGITYTVNGIISTVVNVTMEGIYDIVASDATGCEKNFQVKVSKANCASCHETMPGAFTPNGDGLNDIFRPKFSCNISSVALMIFNKWGQKIFESKDTNKGWDGTYMGSGLPSGVYVYAMQYRTINNVAKTAKGTVVLIR